MSAQNKIKIVIGDQNLSSWSMRPWLVLKTSGLPFQQIKILLDRPDTHQKIQKYSPTGKVPVLQHNQLTLWDSLAICEYIAELAPDKHLWPEDSQLRAQARSYVAEMHSGFSSLRDQCSMDIHLKIKATHLLPQTIRDIERILELWSLALQKNHGPFLFGSFGIVDAFYAPVVMRFISYGIHIQNKMILKYMDNVKNHFSVKAWVKEARKEKRYIRNF